ncbi:TetR family transcriptional regulator [Luteibacter rhizovicinus DSM 16549]|uniref:TetR family transcriptional regulator n=1 Tax=Luteibacter rhizovicinus DSM 16549 TaxID=1440763 RepID=A0A0G9H4A9_9GAMM|nr:TetR/AcrR family transcriptional regulator [Luteibacter rhizovicinus]APG05724.1 TetR family transcriptional regulator [Luteibacter rhizovicinus DSM 16549]KLD64625.1 TetR family transcriptional regulator [Luteibacter rhizovicinus DSM 16549]KLD74280.1 TetR family transcriptional regulator [Xanthomonas hyacinthi DSM 19077]
MARAVFERADVIPLVAEAFRELGYDGASMSRITERTGLGKGSLYHFFPGGKEEMAAAVLADVDDWFEQHVFVALREGEPEAALAAMWRDVDAYFQSGGRVCLVGAFALDETRDRFAAAISGYFVRWIDALASALVRLGREEGEAREQAEDTVLGIQGALLLSRATQDAATFRAALQRMARRLGTTHHAQL